MSGGMNVDLTSVGALVAQLGVAGVIVRVLLARDEADRAERTKREDADRAERSERLRADLAQTTAIASMTEVLRGFAETVARLGK
jgi:hypothetical protein